MIKYCSGFLEAWSSSLEPGSLSKLIRKCNLIKQHVTLDSGFKSAVNPDHWLTAPTNRLNIIKVVLHSIFKVAKFSRQIKNTQVVVSIVIIKESY